MVTHYVQTQRWSRTHTNIGEHSDVPDLSVCDFYLWGYRKLNVYQTKPRNLNKFKRMWMNHRRGLGDNSIWMLERVLNKFFKRLERNPVRLQYIVVLLTKIEHSNYECYSTEILTFYKVKFICLYVKKTISKRLVMKQWW